MPHRIGKHEDIGTALLRLVADDLAAVRAALSGGTPSDRTVHRVRQRLKRVRSVLKVLKPALGETARQAAGRIRDAGRLLSKARDADVAAESARQFTSTAHGDEAGFGRVAHQLDREAREAGSVSVEGVAALIAASERDLAEVSDDLDGEALLVQAIGRAYKRGDKARRQAEASLATPDLHEWRKEVKDLWHLLRLARRRLPRRTAKLADEFKRLGELLGVDHDHAVLAGKLAAHPTADPALMQQLALIAKRRRALEAEALIAGADLYTRRPKAFRRQVSLD